MTIFHYYYYVGGPYTGVGGIGYAMLRVARILPKFSKMEQGSVAAYHEYCETVLGYQLDRSKVQAVILNAIK